jgi:hypothetical protein
MLRSRQTTLSTSLVEVEAHLATRKRTSKRDCFPLGSTKWKRIQFPATLSIEIRFFFTGSVESPE